MKYQIGEVVRFAETPNNETANLVGKLATITNYGGVEREWYQTAVTGNRWFPPGEFEPVNGGMKPAGESVSDTPLTYQLGEVIRFADTPSNREKQLCGKLATLISVDHGDPETYQTARTADEWFYAGAFESVNGGMPKPKEESTSDSVALSIKSLCDAAKTLNNDDLETLHAVVKVESECRHEQQRCQLAAAIVSAMAVYLRQVGDSRAFYSRGGEYMSMQEMYDAIVDEFDLNAQ